MSHADLIKALGGPAKVASDLGLPGNHPERVVWNWGERHSGVPAVWRAPVARLAEAAGLELPPGFLEKVGLTSESIRSEGANAGAAA